MAAKTLTEVLRDIGRAGRLKADLALPDADLLDRFVRRRDECAFAALVARHGPLVFGVCRRLLADANDAEDAFQATFLILVRRAGGIARPGLLGNWLYGVAYRVASRVRKTTRRQAGEPIDVAELPAKERGDRETAWLLHDEIARLPDKYRDPVTLCYLEGKTDEEAADQLRWPVGTVKGRLHRARQLLRSRLARQGLALSAGLLTRATASAVPPVLLDSTIRAASSFAAGDAAAGGLASLKAVALTKGVLHTMLLTKMKGPALVALLLAVLGLSMGLVWHTAAAEPGAGRGKTRLAFRDKPAEKAKSDKEKIQGTWKVESFEAEGEDVSDKPGEGKQLKDSTWVIDTEEIKVTSGDKVIKFKYTLDEKAKPRAIDLTVTEAPGDDIKDKTFIGVYTLDGDTLKLCLPMAPGSDRPTEVGSKAGSKTSLMILKREKPAEKKKDEAAKAKDDKELLRGRWEVVAVEAGGKDVSDKQGKLKGFVWEFTADKVIAGKDGKAHDESAYKIDPFAKPKAIDLTLGSDKKTVRAVYTLEGDTLKICRPLNPDDDRPDEVKTKEGSETLLLVLKREKPAEKKKDEAAKAKDDKELLQGKWTVRMVEEEGKDVTDDERFKGWTMEFTGDKVKTGVGDKFVECTVKLDATAKPKQIDLDVVDSSEEVAKNNSFKGVYALDGDTLKICSPIAANGDRPDALESKEGSKTFLLVLKREKK